MMIQKTFSTFALISLCACAQTSPSVKPINTTSMQEPSTMNTMDASHISTEELGGRFLKLVDSIKTSKDLTLEHVRKVTKLPMDYSDENRTYLFSNDSEEADLYYRFNYYQNTNQSKKMFWYEDNAAGEKKLWLEFEYLDDKKPVCAIKLENYTTALKQMGFIISIERDKNGMYQSWNLSKPENKIIGHVVIDQAQAPSPDDDLSKSCVKSIFLTFGD